MSDEYGDILIRIRCWDEESGAYPVEAVAAAGDVGGEAGLHHQANGDRSGRIVLDWWSCAWQRSR